ncbi:MAG: hypothetical protein HDR88_08025 [Bacteroides sp.]|nr:hypothetical protein [Bacteroides sp.]
MVKLFSEIVRVKVLAMLLFFSVSASAQIGYQVSLLNTATGEPRANESVNVTVKITDSAGNVVCEETKREVTNDFGVLSMTVGSQDTFTNTDWSKLPLFIEATVDGRLIGRSQILSVPVAEHAKHVGVLTKDLLCSKVWTKYNETYEFNLDNTFTRKYYSSDNTISTIKEKYYIQDNMVILMHPDHDEYAFRIFVYIEDRGILMNFDGYTFMK